MLMVAEDSVHGQLALRQNNYVVKKSYSVLVAKQSNSTREKGRRTIIGPVVAPTGIYLTTQRALY